jgi:ABC-type glycerol-3-phosphate transport system substrate-binding protein
MCKLERREFLRLAAGAGAAAVVAGCVPAATPEPAAAPTVGEPEGGPTEAEAPTVGAPDEVVTVRYLMWGQVTEWEDAMLKQFEAENPDIAVEYVVGDPFKVMAMIAAGDAPDIWWANTVGLLAREEELLALDPFIDLDEEYQQFLDDFIPSILETYRYNGTLYGLPKDANAWCIRYNKYLFDEAGVAYPEPGWTWDDIMDKAATLNELGEDIIGLMHGFWVPGWWEADHTTWVHQNDARMITEEGLLTLDQERPLEAIRFVHRAVHEENWSSTGAQVTGLGVDWTVQILQDTLAMAYDLTGGAFAAYQTLDEDNAYADFVQEGKYGVAALPIGAVEANTLYNGGFVAWAGTQHPQATYRLITYVCGPEGIEAVLTESANLPANTSIDWVAFNMDKPGFTAERETMEWVFENVQTGFIPFDRNDPRWDDTEVQDLLGSALDEVLNQGEDPDQILPEVTKEINDRLRELADEFNM